MRKRHTKETGQDQGMNWLNNAEKELSNISSNSVVFIKDDMVVLLIKQRPQYVKTVEHYIPSIGRSIPCQQDPNKRCYVCENIPNARVTKRFLLPVYDIANKRLCALATPVTVFSMIIEYAKEYGDAIYTTPLLIRRKGSGQATKYSVLPKTPKKPISPVEGTVELTVREMSYDEQEEAVNGNSDVPF